MVQNLNVLSFAPYGNLLAERSDGAAMPKGAHWEERILSVTAQETYQYCPKESVYLDYQSGMSILAVAKEQEEFSISTWTSPCASSRACGLPLRPTRKAAPFA